MIDATDTLPGGATGLGDDDEFKDMAVEVEASGDTGDDPVVEEAADAPKTPVITPDEGIETLKARLAETERREAAERQRAAEAEARAKAASEKIQGTYWEQRRAQYQQAQSTLGQLEEQRKNLRAQKVEAYSLGDYQKVAELDEALAVNVTLTNDWSRAKGQIEAEVERARREAENPTAPRPVAPDRAPSAAEVVDSLASQASPRSASWLRANRDALSDDRKVQRMIRAHQDAVDDGIEPDTDEYFGYIERRLGMNKEAPAANPAPAPARREATPAAAPVSRDGGGKRTIRLTAAQIEAAQIAGVTPQQYAKQLMSMQK